MSGLALLFTTGSPFARAVRIVLDELSLEYERREEITTPTVEERARKTPTLQVPTLWDNGTVLWESGLIIEYLLASYSERREELYPMADTIARPESYWRDRLVMSTVQTLGTAVTTISQMKWGGTGVRDAAYLARSAERGPHLIRWLEGELESEADGFMLGTLSAQDVLLTCHLDFVENRPIDVSIDLENAPKLRGLLKRARARSSFRDNPILWWEPGIIGYESDGTPIRG